MEAFLASLAVVFVAEIGDKSQILTLSFATRYRLLPVLGGVIAASATLMALAVVAGNLVGDLIPTRVVLGASAALFLAFGWWTLRTGDDDQGADGDATSDRRRFAFFAVFGAFTLAELGDKTMLATFTLAAGAPGPATWAGATLGMVGANLLALAVGRALGASVSPRTRRYGSAGLFFAMAVLLAIQTV